MPRIIIMAAGQGKRWTGDRPKQLTEIDGEPILYRTIRLLLEHGQTDVHVTASEELFRDIASHIHPPVRVFIPENNVQEIDRFLSCKEVWGEETLFLYGDAYYTNEAIATMLNKFAKPATFYGRRKKNEVKAYGEMFGLRADTSNPNFEVELLNIRTAEIAGKKRGIGWDVFRAYEKRNFVELDPMVEDFDKVSDAINWSKEHGKIVTV